MRIKLILLTLLIVAAVFFVNFNSSKNSYEMTESSEIEQPTDAAIDPINTSNPTEQKTITDKESIKPEKIDDNKPALLNDVTYSADPVVNAHTIYRNNQLCYSQLEKTNSTSIYMQQFLERMDTKQAQYFKNYLDYCRQLDKQHPEYSLTDKDSVLEQMKKAKPTSLWGKVINNEIAVEDLTHYEIQELLKSNDINILQDAPRYLETYYQEVVHWDLESYLGNHDYDYVNYIQQYSHQMYLCDLGADCGVNSTIMASLCYINQSACGMNFIEFVDTQFTQGQKADIQLALTYLRNQYN